MSTPESGRTGLGIWRELRSLCGRVLMRIVLPTALVVGFVEYTAWRLDLTASAEQVADRLLASKDAIFARDPYQAQLVKKILIDRIKPEVLFAGTSRVNQFRAAMLAPYTFYNHSNALISWTQYSDLIDRLPPGYHPKVIFFSLDFWMFYQKFVTEYGGEFLLPEPHGWQVHLQEIRELVENVFKRWPYVVFAPARDPIHGGPAIGVGAILMGQGFRNDGSIQYGYFYRNQYPQAHLRQAPGQSPLYVEDDFEAKPKHDFEEFVRKAQIHGIALVGVSLPISAGTVERLDADPQMGNWKLFNSPEMHAYFKSLGIHYVDCVRLSGYVSNKLYFIDTFHPTEPADLACLVQMLEDPEIHALLPQISLPYLKAKLEDDATHSQHIDLF